MPSSWKWSGEAMFQLCFDGFTCKFSEQKGILKWILIKRNFRIFTSRKLWIIFWIRETIFSSSHLFNNHATMSYHDKNRTVFIIVWMKTGIEAVWVGTTFIDFSLTHLDWKTKIEQFCKHFIKRRLKEVSGLVFWENMNSFLEKTFKKLCQTKPKKSSVDNIFVTFSYSKKNLTLNYNPKR